MLIPQNEVLGLLQKFNITISGVIHIGAHDCEELPFYRRLGVTELDMVWVDAIPDKVQQGKARGIQNIYQAVISDRDNEKVNFKITNNVQSSSILEFGTHATHHSHVHFVSSLELETTTIKTFFEKNKLDTTKYDFWNLDIQGVELMALKSAGDILKNVKVLYLEVNTEEVYKGCGLIGDIDEYVAGFGFKRVRTEMTQFGWGDAIYIKL